MGHYSFLDDLHISPATAFIEYAFAPPNLRRDIAMMGFLYKRVLNQCHPAFLPLLPLAEARTSRYEERHPRHTKQLATHPNLGHFQQLLYNRSIFNLIPVFNKLPPHFVEVDTISEFQTLLTDAA